MAEPRRDSRYSIEFDDGAGRKPLLPDAKASEYLHQWFRDLRNGKLDWFAAKPDPKQLLGGVHVRPGYGTGADLTVAVAAVHPDIGAGIMPSVGVAHCGRSAPLHGEVNILLPQLSDIGRPDIDDVLSALNAKPNLDTGDAYLTEYPLIPISPIPYEPLQSVRLGKHDLLGALDLAEKDEFLGLFDPLARRASAAAVYLLRQRGMFFPKQDTSAMLLTLYQKRFLAAGQPLVEYDEYDFETDSDTLRQRLQTSLAENGLGEKDSLTRQLSTYYETHPGVEQMFAGYPDMNVEIKLSAQMHRVSTDAVISYADYLKAIARLVPQANIPRIPPHAQRLGEIDDIHNMILISSSGQKLGLYLARSSGICRNHDTPD